MALGFVEATGDCCQAPILVRFVKFGRVDTCALKARTKIRQLTLITNSNVDVRGVLVSGATKEIRVFDCCVCSLHGLLREWDIAARDGVEVMCGGLGLHDKLTGC